MKFLLISFLLHYAKIVISQNCPPTKTGVYTAAGPKCELCHESCKACSTELADACTSCYDGDFLYQNKFCLNSSCI